jgi:hypothetical protein
MKIISTVILSIVTLFASTTIMPCAVSSFYYEWPLFNNQESSVELEEEAKEFLKYLLTACKEGREFALDAWSQKGIRDGIKNALGFKKYRDELREASKSNDFALHALQTKIDNAQILDRLAKSQNPSLLTEAALNPMVTFCFWQDYYSIFDHVEGRCPREKILNAAINAKWNQARIEKANFLFELYSKDKNSEDLEEAFKNLRYAANKGFINAMYKLYEKLPEHPAFETHEYEWRMWLEVAAALDDPWALYMTSTYFFEENDFVSMRVSLERILFLVQDNQKLLEYKDAALILLDLAYLRERQVRDYSDEIEIVVMRRKASGKLIPNSVVKTIRVLRSFFEEIESMSSEFTKEINQKEDVLSTPGHEDVEADANIVTQESLSVALKTDKEEKVSIVNSQVKKSNKKNKVSTRKAKRRVKNDNISQALRSSTPMTTDISFSDNPFAESIKRRFKQIEGLVAIILSGGHLNGREIQAFLNAFRSANVENVVGSHHKLNIQYTEEAPMEKLTIVTPHKGHGRDLTGQYKSISAKLKSLLNGLGIRTIEDLH